MSRQSNGDFPGLHTVRSKNGVYHYAWRGGPRIKAKRGTPAFNMEFAAAHAARKSPAQGNIQSLVIRYRDSDAYAALADSTKRNWSKWLDRIGKNLGSIPLKHADRVEHMRPQIRKWRNKWADKPRTADYGLTVLSRVCAYGVDPLGELTSNPCEGIKRLYTTNRSEIIWTEADIARLKVTAPPEIAAAVDLAAYTGLRLGDLLRLSWSHVGADAIVLRTGKSRGKREAIVPIYDDLRALLERIPRRATTVLTSSKRRPWTVNGFGSSFNKAKIKADMQDDNLHFHDLRGTAATRFYLANIPIRAIAEILAWDEDAVDRIIRRYVDRSAVTKALIARLNAPRAGTDRER